MRIIVMSFAILGIALSAVGKNDKKSHNWKLVWEDTFDKDGSPDSAKWSYIKRSGGCYSYMTNTGKDSYVKGGKLILRAENNTGPNDTAHFTTGGIQTRGKYNFLYGKIEVRAKLGAGKGSWPAIWLMPEKDQPLYGEIDIMEQLNHDSIIYQTIHSHYTLKLGFKDDPPHSTTVKYNVGKFNIFGLEWYSDRLDLTLNGKCTFSYPKIKTDKPGQWTFDKPYYIILNQALGGWAGTIDPRELPLQMEVDWVKVYQMKN